jgi:hypothetical protein
MTTLRVRIADKLSLTRLLLKSHTSLAASVALGAAILALAAFELAACDSHGSGPKLYGALGASEVDKCPEGTVPFKPRGEERFATCIDTSAATYIYCVDNILYSSASYSGTANTRLSATAPDASSISTEATTSGQGTVNVSDTAIDARSNLARQCGRFVPSDDGYSNAMLLPPGEDRLRQLRDVLVQGSVSKRGVWQWTYPEDRWLVRARFRIVEIPVLVGPSENTSVLPHSKQPTGTSSRDAGANVEQLDSGDRAFLRPDSGSLADQLSLYLFAQMWYCDNDAGGECGVREPDGIWQGVAKVDNTGGVTISDGTLSFSRMQDHALGHGGHYYMALKLRPGPILDGLWYGINSEGRRSETPGNVIFIAP